MTLESMTGYALSEGVVALDGLEQTWRWSWELRSVNSKTFDLRTKLPSGRESLNAIVKKEIMYHIKRGSITASLIRKFHSTDKKLKIDKVFLSQLCKVYEEFERDGLIVASPPNLERMLLVPGVVEPVAAPELSDSQNKIIDDAIVDGLREAVALLIHTRRIEGAGLLKILKEQLLELECLCGEAKNIAQNSKQKLSEKLMEQVNLVLSTDIALSKERLAQELAIIVTKLDVSEEIDRLLVHFQACENLLMSNMPIGRRLDFICQELNRETNTLCSKSNDSKLTSIGIDMKVGIEKFREQIQNVQ
jgi:uncharacterized protein (TIGR00255 family)